jgi:hypothetical protein
MLVLFSKGVVAMSDEYSQSDVLERMYENQIALEAALMELTLHAEKQGWAEVGDNVRSALWAIGENAGHIKQGLARLKGRHKG